MAKQEHIIEKYSKIISKDILVLAGALSGFAVVLLAAPGTIIWPIKSTLAVMTLAVILWVFEPIPLPLSALTIIVVLVITQAANVDLALSGFASGSVFLIMAGFMMAKAINSTPLGTRIAYLLLVKSKNTPGGALAAILLALEILTFFVPATAVRTALLLPVVLGIIGKLEVDRPVPNIRKILLLGLAFGANITGLGLLPGAIANVITADLLFGLTGTPLTYLDWMLYTFPVSLVLLPLTWFVLLKSFPPETQVFPGGKEAFQERLKELGLVSSEEKRCIGVMVFTLILWMTEGWHGLHSSIPALLAVILMSLPKIGCTSWNQVSQIQWGTVILVATTLSLGNVMNKTGAAQFVAGSFFGLDWIAGIFTIPVLAVMVITLFTQIYHLGVGNVATVTITLVPIVYQLALHLGENAFLMALVAGIASLFGFILVVETIPNVLVYGTGLINSRDFIYPGIILTVLVTVVIGLAAWIWWPMTGLVGR